MCLETVSRPETGLENSITSCDRRYTCQPTLFSFFVWIAIFPAQRCDISGTLGVPLVVLCSFTNLDDLKFKSKLRTNEAKKLAKN